MQKSFKALLLFSFVTMLVVFLHLVLVPYAGAQKHINSSGFWMGSDCEGPNNFTAFYINIKNENEVSLIAMTDSENNTVKNMQDFDGIVRYLNGSDGKEHLVIVIANLSNPISIGFNLVHDGFTEMSGDYGYYEDGKAVTDRSPIDFQIDTYKGDFARFIKDRLAACK